MTRFFLLIGLAFLNFLVFPYYNSPAFASFNPTTSGSISTLTLGVNPTITLNLSLPAGDEFPDYATITIPAGFDINAGTNLPNGATVGTVSTSFVHSGVPYNLNFPVENVSNTAWYKAIWKYLFPDPFCCLYSGIEGSAETGYTFTIDALFSNLETPMTFTLNIFGTVSGIPVITNPTIAGEYRVLIDVVSMNGITVNKNVLINYPATTSPGTNETDTFNGGISITYDKVTGQGGETTITSSPTPPAAGTGQFQLDGFYYDLNTTASIRCPCTVTLPYNPETTPDPRIYHLESGVWTDATTSFSLVAKTVTGVVSSFSFFAVGQPIYNLTWQNPIVQLIENYGNPFSLEDDERLGIKFNLENSDNQIVTPANVKVEIWQIADSAGNPLEETVKAVTLTPEINQTLKRFQIELDVKEAGLVLGTYNIIVLVENTTAAQVFQTASFTVTED